MKTSLILLSAVSLFFISSCASLEDMRSKLGGGNSKTDVPVTYLSNGIFVSVDTGNDTNIGTNRLEPVKSMQTGISNAVLLGLTNVFVAKGVYTPMNGGLRNTNSGVMITNHNIFVLGGCDLDFNTTRNGYSELDKNQLNTFSVIVISGCTNVMIDRVVIRNGFSDNGQSAGLHILQASNILIINSIISNNSNAITTTVSGGITVMSSQFKISNCIIENNSGYYGGMCCVGTGNDIDIEYNKIINNTALSNGGGIYIGIGSVGKIIGNIICNNNAFSSGGIRLYNAYCIYMYDNIITNNWSTYVTNALFTIISSGLQYYTNMIISNCIFGGTNHSDQYGILTYSSVSTRVSTNFMFLNNGFITNTLFYLYSRNSTGIVSITNWYSINDTNFIGVNMATNNWVTNM